MTERTHSTDPNDRPPQDLDSRLIEALTQTDMLIKDRIKAKIGEAAYREYEVRHDLDQSLDAVGREAMTAAFGKPLDHIEKEAADIARDMIESGVEDMEEVERQSWQIAFSDYLGKIIDHPEDEPYLNALDEVTKPLLEKVTKSLALRYSGIVVDEVGSGMFSLSRSDKDERGVGPYTVLHISFAVNGTELDTKVAYAMWQRDFRTKPEIVPIDPIENGMVEDINLEELKKDVINSLRTITDQ